MKVTTQFRLNNKAEILLLPYYFIFYGIYSIYDFFSDGRNSHLNGGLHAAAYSSLTMFEVLNISVFISKSNDFVYYWLCISILILLVINYLLLIHKKKYIKISEDIEHGRFSKFNSFPEIIAIGYIVLTLYTAYPTWHTFADKQHKLRIERIKNGGSLDGAR